MMAASSAWIRSSVSQSPHSGISTGKRRVRRVLIVDDHPIVRQGLCRIMENEDDLVVCVLRGGFSRVEQTLLQGGRGAIVVQQRVEFQELMRERFEAVIEHATGRRVIGFMSGNQQEPDMMCEVFILAPTDLVSSDELR